MKKLAELNNLKYKIFTWGCQMNEDDSEQIAALLSSMGYSQTDDENEADVAILVTCSVRNKPEDKARSKLGELNLIKQNKPNMIIGVCGCMAQKEGKALRKGRPYLNFVVGTSNIHRIPELVAMSSKGSGFMYCLEMPEKADEKKEVPIRTNRNNYALKSFVPVMYGCDNFCSYCVVPYVRGRERSRELDDIISEIKKLAENGRKEITLVGQNVNSYGATLNKKIDFSDLLYEVSKIDGIERIRFTTSHPKDLSDKLIYAIRDIDKVCEHIHLAVQSGDNTVLERMNRKYTSEHFLERVQTLRKAVPNIAITTDFLVGFPGETQEQFENTLKLAEKVRFDSAYMFSYNIIPNTEASKYKDQLTKKEKNRRLAELIKLQNSITCEINSSEVGNEYEVMVEGISSKDKNKYSGLTRTGKTVNFSGSECKSGDFVVVKTTSAHLYGFTGELVCKAAKKEACGAS
ncbi:MAG: tRNA (N6-isopentenyl adenosine(37)-C2)-methylthiotransferase MiaB [Armatimonadota bacterium]